MKKEVFFGICWSGDGQECEKEAFFGKCWSGDGQGMFFSNLLGR